MEVLGELGGGDVGVLVEEGLEGGGEFGMGVVPWDWCVCHVGVDVVDAVDDVGVDGDGNGVDTVDANGDDVDEAELSERIE